MLDQLRLLGVFDEVAGILIGDFSDSANPEDESYQIQDLMKDFFQSMNKPVIANMKCGHCFPTATLPMGAMCEINTDQKIIRFYK